MELFYGLVYFVKPSTTTQYETEPTKIQQKFKSLILQSPVAMYPKLSFNTVYLVASYITINSNCCTNRLDRNMHDIIYRTDSMA